jgi:hypothetical protein
MPNWSLFDSSRFEAVGIDTANSRGTTVTTGVANTKTTSWVQIVASTAFDYDTITIVLSDVAAGGDFLVDIAIGAASSEVIVAANLSASSGTGSISRGAVYVLPIPIPAGSRISAKSQSNLASATVRVCAYGSAGGFAVIEPMGRVTTYGANTADSGGTSVDPGGVAHTKGTADPGTTSGGWFQITSSTTNPIRALILAFPNQANGTRTSGTWLVDVGIGAQGSRTVIIPNLLLQASTTDDTMVPNVLGPFYVNIPAATAIAIRCQSVVIDATDRLFDVIVYGID